MASKPYPHVLIVGAGLAGLTLAQALRKQSVSFELFERDANESVRPQGWAIGIHTMLDDLKASLPDDMPSIEETNHLHPLTLPAQIVFYNHKHPEQRLGVQDDGTGKILRANRHKLRDWLRTDLTVSYDKKAISVEESSDKVTLHFKDGTSASGDILVGADGVHSIVREHIVRQDKLQTVPIGIIVGEVKLSGNDMAAQLEMGHSSYVATSPSVTMFVGLNQVLPDAKTGSYFWLLTWRDDDAAQEPYWTASAEPQKLLDAARDRVQDLDPRFRAIVEKTTVEGIVHPPLVIRDILLSPDDIPVGRTTILGDAAHSMTPFRGEGGATAMTNALELARLLIRIRDQKLVADGDEFLKVMAEYRDKMLELGAAAVRRSRAAYMERSDNPEGPRYAWGAPAQKLPEETITV